MNLYVAQITAIDSMPIIVKQALLPVNVSSVISNNCPAKLRSPGLAGLYKASRSGAKLSLSILIFEPPAVTNSPVRATSAISLDASADNGNTYALQPS